MIDSPQGMLCLTSGSKGSCLVEISKQFLQLILVPVTACTVVKG